MIVSCPFECCPQLHCIEKCGLTTEHQTFTSSVWYVSAQSWTMAESAVDMNLAVFCDYIPCLYRCSYVPTASLTVRLVDVCTS